MIWLLAVLAALAAFTLLAPELATRAGLGMERALSRLRVRTAAGMPYLEGGQGEALLLIHGFAGDKDNFTRIARFLTPHYHVLIPDLPGFGEAGRDATASHSLAAQVDNVHRFLTALGITRVHIGGNSMGGAIAAQFAATYPAMTASVWLLDPAGTDAAHGTPIIEHYHLTGEMPLLLKDAAKFEHLLAVTTHKPVFLPGFVRKTLARRAVADFELHTQIMRELHGGPLLEDQFKELDTPAFVVWGAQDQVLHPNGAQAVAALFRSARVRIMEGIGHLPMAEAPRETALDYLEFRRSLS